MQQQGWIKLHRELQEKVIWKLSTPEQKAILITLLLLANHKTNEWEFAGEKYRCVPGQLVTSLNSIAEACGKGISVQNVRTALSRFERLGFLTNQSTKTGRLITIVNWEVYQVAEDIPNKGNNNELTKFQQSPIKELTPNKNVKNEQNVKKFIKPTIDEVQAYCVERNNGIDAQRFVDFYESKGWMVGRSKMKDWKAAIRTWEQNNKKGAKGSDGNIAEQRAEYEKVCL